MSATVWFTDGAVSQRARDLREASMSYTALFLEQLWDYHKQRVKELLEANNREVERRRAAEANKPGELHPSNGFERVGALGLQALTLLCHDAAVKAGWWDAPREKGTTLMLIVSEIAEAMEGERKDAMDDHLPFRKMAEVELADALIRIFDYAGRYGYDLAGALTEKLAYNRTRADHQREARAAPGGKKW